MRVELDTTFGSIEQIQIAPGHGKWRLYLELMVEYLAAHWPAVLDGTTRADFLVQHEAELSRRIAEGGRHLLLWCQNGEPIGFANAYLEGEGRRRSLYIAEFCVPEPLRRRGLGRVIFAALVDVGRRNGARHVVAEVDKNMPANAFWNRILGSCNGTGLRNVYSAPVEPVRVIFLRHAEVEIPPDARERCVEQSSLSLSGEGLRCAGQLTAGFARSFAGRGKPLVVSSPLLRCQQTAQSLLGNGAPLRTDERLCEFFPAELVGRSWKEILGSYGQDLDMLLLHGDFAQAFPHSEAPEAAAERALAACRDLAMEPSVFAERLVVSHQMLHALLVLRILQAPLTRRSGILLNHLHVTSLLFEAGEPLPVIEYVNRPAQTLWTDGKGA